MTSSGDDIERLLREVDAMGAGGAATGGASAQGKEVAGRASSAPSSKGRKGKEVADSGGTKGGRFAFAVVAAVVVGLIGAFAGMVLGPVLGWLPLLDFGFWSTGLGAAFGAFLTALVAGPPRWFDGD